MIPNLNSEEFAFGLLALFGVNGVVAKLHAIAPSSGKASHFLTTYTRSPTGIIIVAKNLLKVLRDKYDKSLERAKEEVDRTPILLWELSR